MVYADGGSLSESVGVDVDHKMSIRTPFQPLSLSLYASLSLSVYPSFIGVHALDGLLIHDGSVHI